jgi:hypothetical protein
MFKILADYPDREGTVMPPRWAGDVELEEPVTFRDLTWDEILLIEDWIQLGAHL